MKLELHLIPETTFYINLRNQMGSWWNVLSKNIREQHNYTCQICNVKKERKNIHLHEIWQFDIKNKIQKLIGFECVCNFCHSVHHWGCSQIQNKDMYFLREHACKVNNCSNEEWDNYIFNCFEEWRERSKIEWKIDTTYINKFRLDLI